MAGSLDKKGFQLFLFNNRNLRQLKPNGSIKFFFFLKIVSRYKKRVPVTEATGKMKKIIWDEHNIIAEA
ncbi:hypothetical protein [Enterococcus xiangfangensis]|uniref:hypothetical protein n=1 Tax=Enterococcus xiangfangensis TaxID=1296537 RepID=UPI003D17ADCB|nr:hypothetical protein [Enterococcus asini]